MQVVLSLLLVGAGLYVVLSQQDQTLQKAATGWIGIVVGYWLR